MPADQRKARGADDPAPYGRAMWGRRGGSPGGCGACGTAASRYVGPSRTMARRSTAMESPLPCTARDDRRRGPSQVARPQDPPSPGAARRPLPARERRLFVASLKTTGSVLSASSTEQTLPAGNVGATRWVAPGVRCTRANVFGDVGPACTTVPGRRTASPLHAVRRAPCVGARNFVGARLRGL